MEHCLPRFRPNGVRWYVTLASLVIVASVLAGCDDEEELEGGLKGPASSPPIISLAAAPNSVSSGDSSTLSWSVSNADHCEASGAWSGDKSLSGNQLVGPLTGSSTFLLHCSRPNFSSVASVTVVVDNLPPPQPPTVSLSANPSSVDLGDSSTLTWSSTDATSCTASGAWSGQKATAGNQGTGALTSTSTFTLVCGGPGGSAGQSITVTVDAPPLPPAPTVSLSANPSSIPYDGSSTLNWSSTNATSCVASGDWSGNKAISGSKVKNNLTATSTFILTCSGDGGSAGQSVTVTVDPPPLPTVSLSADPSTVNAGGVTTLTWSTSNADSCEGRKDWSGPKPLSGSEVVGPLTETSLFKLRCTGPGGITNVPVTVTVEDATNGTADLSWIPPTTNEDGSPFTPTGFNVYLGSTANNLQQVDSIGANQTTYTVTGLAVGTHYFSITAIGNTGESSFSNVENKVIP